MSVDLVHAVALAGLTFLLVEVALRLPFGASVAAMVAPSLRSVAVLRAPGISEHWKERAMLLYAGRTLRGVTQFTTNLGRVAVVALGFGAAMAWAIPGFVDFSLGAMGVFLAMAVAALWLALRARLTGQRAVPKPDYSPAEQFMHRVVLGNDAVAEMTFALDQKLWRHDIAVAQTGAHVFVAGLARAGTTVLTRALHDSGAFGSLTYRDMPFVLAPNLWQSMPVRGRQRASAGERAHGDGIVVGIDSVESLEEPFWRVFDRNAYLKTDRLLPHEPDAELVEKYRHYLAAILRARGANRYLAKNNNNILRLGTLAQAFPNAHILVPFRHPLAQAASLHAQHDRFLALHRSEPFSRDYMGWLAHHDFGSDHRHFALGALTSGDPSSFEYWLTQWCNVYRWLLETAPESARFICYEDLCNDPNAWPCLAAAIGLDPAQASPFRTTQPRQLEGVSALGAQAMDIFAEMRSRSDQNSVKSLS